MFNFAVKKDFFFTTNKALDEKGFYCLESRMVTRKCFVEQMHLICKSLHAAAVQMERSAKAAEAREAEARPAGARAEEEARVAQEAEREARVGPVHRPHPSSCGATSTRGADNAGTPSHRRSECPKLTRDL